ncbi:uncharacterized protein EI90DRAFT_3122770 [Cantharellus anzutake]|uniref:uncharacterized protein n=1 Tax=Cantharellus anzutake TaxID=1750568 RepID=UPI001903393A|nr:uncharacterized protein EI90DRAFT_3122770 [Cantharellus anzutake]KAF8332317.1 hypothetical protein EI90DRAFT_3122770 [Cantharellus anzutake]
MVHCPEWNIPYLDGSTWCRTSHGLDSTCHIPESRPHALPPHHTFLTTSPSPTPRLPTPQVTFPPDCLSSETPDLLRYPDGPPTSRDTPLNHSSTHFIYLSHPTSFGYATPLSELPASFGDLTHVITYLVPIHFPASYSALHGPTPRFPVKDIVRDLSVPLGIIRHLSVLSHCHLDFD